MFDDALTHTADNGWQFVATDMSMGLVEQAVVATKMMEEFHDALHIAALLAARKEFAIGECACAPFAEAVIGLSIESLVAVERSDVLLALGNLFTAFVDNRTDAVLDKRECSKEARRSSTNNGYTKFGVVHILEMWWLVERNRCILRKRCAMLVCKHSKMNFELLLASIYRTLYDAVALLRVVSFLRG